MLGGFGDGFEGQSELVKASITPVLESILHAGFVEDIEFSDAPAEDDSLE